MIEFMYRFSLSFSMFYGLLFLFITRGAWGGELLFLNGDRIAWDAPGVEGELLRGMIPWETSSVRAPIHSVRRWQTRADPPEKFPGQAWLGLRDGSLLQASGITIKDDTIRWTSTWGESLSLPMDHVWTLAPIPAGREAAPGDLLDPGDWRFAGRTEDPPYRVGMELNLPGPRNFTMFRELPLAEPVRVDLRLRFDQSDPQYVVGLHVPRPGNLGRGSLRVLSGQGRTRLNHDLGGMKWPVDEMLEFQADRHRLHHIRIHSDWRAGRFELWMNGRLHHKWFRPGEPPPVPPWLGLGFSEGDSVVIESFQITPWAPFVTQAEAEAIPPDLWRVLLRNGDELYGEIVALDATHLRLRTSENNQVPVRFAVIQELRAGSAGEIPRVPMEILLHGAQRLRAGVEDWGGETLTVRPPGAVSDWRIPREHLATILFNTSRPPPEAVGRHSVRFRSGHRLRGELTGLTESVLRLRPWFDETTWELPVDLLTSFERDGNQAHTDGDRVRFVNGDFLRGKLLETPEDAPVLDHPLLGTLRLRPETLLAVEAEAERFWIDSVLPIGRWQVILPSRAEAQSPVETPQGLHPEHGQLHHALPELPERLRLHLRLHSGTSPFFDLRLHDTPPETPNRRDLLRIFASNARPRLDGDPPGPLLPRPPRENHEFLYIFEFDFTTGEAFMVSEDRKQPMGTFPNFGTREGVWFSFHSDHPAFSILELRLKPASFPPPPEPGEIPGAARVHFAEGGQRVILSGWRQEAGVLRLRSPLWDGEASLDPRHIFLWEASFEPQP